MKLILVKSEIIMILQPHIFIVTMKGRFDPKELPPTISAHVKRVEVTCGVVDERVTKVLMFLSKLNMSKLTNCIRAFDISVVRFNIC